MTDLDRLFRPESVAVVGGREAARVIEQLDLLGFDGEIWPVNPNRSELVGRRCFSSPARLPAPPDAAFIGVPREAASNVVSELAAIGTGAAVVYTSGFAEAGASHLEEALRRSARDMPLLGPNTYGYVNALDSTAIWPDVHGLSPVGAGVGIVTQSGNIGINLTMSRRSLDIALLVTAGNQACVTVSQVIESFLDDDRIHTIGVQLESIADPVDFGAAMLRAAEKGVPVVVLKMGTSAIGAAATASHTGAIAGDSDVYKAFFDHYGAARVESIPSFLETLKLAREVPPDPGVLAICSSGGEAAHFGDIAENFGVRLPPPAADSTPAAHPLVKVGNPMDYHTFSWGDREELESTFRLLDPLSYDVALMILDFPTTPIPEEWWIALDAFAASLEGKTGCVVSSLPETSPPEAQERIRSAGLIPMLGITETLEAISSVGRAAPRKTRHDTTSINGEAFVLDEARAKALIRTAGVKTPAGEVVETATETSISGLLTVKALGYNHKAAVGAVAVGIRQEDLRATMDQMPPTSEFLVEETVEGVQAEILISLRATELGWVLTIGAGGAEVELIDDHSHRMLPIQDGDVERMLDELRIGGRVAEVARANSNIRSTIDKLRELVLSDQTIVEVEINPLAVLSDHVVALDAMIAVQ